MTTAAPVITSSSNHVPPLPPQHSSTLKLGRGGVGAGLLTSTSAVVVGPNFGETGSKISSPNLIISKGISNKLTSTTTIQTKKKLDGIVLQKTSNK